MPTYDVTQGVPIGPHSTPSGFTDWGNGVQTFTPSTPTSPTNGNGIDWTAVINGAISTAPQVVAAFRPTTQVVGPQFASTGGGVNPPKTEPSFSEQVKDFVAANWGYALAGVGVLVALFMFVRRPVRRTWRRVRRRSRR